MWEKKEHSEELDEYVREIFSRDWLLPHITFQVLAVNAEAWTSSEVWCGPVHNSVEQKARVPDADAYGIVLRGFPVACSVKESDKQASGLAAPQVVVRGSKFHGKPLKISPAFAILR